MLGWLYFKQKFINAGTLLKVALGDKSGMMKEHGLFILLMKRIP